MKDLRVPLYLESACPYDDMIKSHIEEENGCVYLYIANQRVGPAETAICWLCNTGKAPKKFKMRAMKKGLPSPMMRVFCDHPGGMVPPNAEELESFWTENVFVLAAGGEVLAVVADYALPSFACFTRHALLRSPYGAPLRELPAETVELIKRNNYRFA